MNKLRSFLFLNKNLGQTILKNTVWQFMANFTAKVSKLFLLIYAARMLGPETYGSFNYIIVMAALCFAFSDIGISTLFNREYQKDEVDKSKLVATVTVIKFLLVGLNFLICLGCLFFIETPLIPMFMLFCVMYVIDSLKRLNVEFARANLRQEIEGIAFIIETGVTAILGFLMLWKFGSVMLLAVSYLAGSTIAALYLVVKTTRYMVSLRHADRHYFVRLLYSLIPFTASSFLFVAITSVDTLMIKNMLGTEAIGLYHSGLKLTDTIQLIPSLFVLSVFPFLSKYQKDSDRLTGLLKKSIAWMAAIGLPVMLGAMFLSEKIYIFLYKAPFMAGVDTFKILILSASTFFMISLFDNLFLATGYQNLSLLTSAISFVFNIGFNLFLIPKFGIAGAAAGTLIARSIKMILNIIFMKQTFKLTGLFSLKSVIYLLVSGLMLVFIYGAQQITENVFLLILVGILSYFGMLLIIKDQNLMYVLNLLNKNPEEAEFFG